MKKLAALIVEKECKEINDDIRENDCITQNKTVRLIKKVKDCKRFIGVSVLFLCISVILTEIRVYFCLKSRKNNVLSY